jgi:HK97 family phage prohead protease
MRYKSLKDYKPGDARHKLLPFSQEAVKASTDASSPDVAGEIEGFAAGLLNIDRGQDIIFPGAFNKDLQEFKDSGVVCYQHDWTAVIGKPTFVEERLEPDYGLFTRSEITATSLGSDVMKLVKRAVLKTLSIGYRLKQGGYAVLNREALAATLKERAIPDKKQSEILADFDRRKLSEVFGLFDVSLFEYSVVTRPMNPAATITGTKGELGEGEGDNLLDGLPFSIHPLVVLGAVKGYAERLKESRAKYALSERNVSITHKEGIKAIREELELLLPEIKAVEELTCQELASPEEINRVLADVLLTESKLLGAGI